MSNAWRPTFQRKVMFLHRNATGSDCSRRTSDISAIQTRLHRSCDPDQNKKMEKIKNDKVCMALAFSSAARAAATEAVAKHLERLCQLAKVAEAEAKAEAEAAAAHAAPYHPKHLGREKKAETQNTVVSGN